MPPKLLRFLHVGRISLHQTYWRYMLLVPTTTSSLICHIYNSIIGRWRIELLMFQLWKHLDMPILLYYALNWLTCVAAWYNSPRDRNLGCIFTDCFTHILRWRQEACQVQYFIRNLHGLPPRLGCGCICQNVSPQLVCCSHQICHYDHR